MSYLCTRIRETPLTPPLWGEQTPSNSPSMGRTIKW